MPTKPPTTRLSTKGQLIIPQEIRSRHEWQPGTEFLVEEQGESLVLRPVADLQPATLEEVVGSAGYEGPALSLEEMEAGIAEGARERR